MGLRKSKTVIGIAVSDQTIFLVQLKRSGDVISLSGFEKKSASGFASNNKQSMLETLEPLFQNLTGSIRNAAIGFAIAEPDVYIHSFPANAKVNVKNTISTYVYEEMERILPIPLSQVIIRYHISQENNARIIAVAVSRDVCNAIIETFRQMQKPLTFLGIESLDASYILVPSPHAPQACIDIGENRSYGIALDAKGIIETFLFDVRTTRFDQALASRFKLTERSAHAQRKSAGLDPDSGAGEIMMFLQKELDPLRTQLWKTLRAYFKETFLEKIILFGSLADTPGIAQFIRGDENIQVELGDPWQNISGVPAHVRRDSSFAVALGVAMRMLRGDSTTFNFANTIETETWSLSHMGLTVFSFLKQRVNIVVVSLLCFGILFFAFSQFIPRLPFLFVEQERQYPVSVEFPVYFGTSTLPTGTIQGALLEYVAFGERTFPASDVKTNFGYATGTVLLYNKTGSTITLKEHTKFTFGNGVSAFTRSRAVIPGFGNREVSAIAEKKGVEIVAGSFSIPNLPATLQNRIYGESLQPFHGAIATTTMASKTDILKARAELEAILIVETIALWTKKLNASEILMPSPLSVESQKDIVSARAGDEIASFQYILELVIQGLRFPQRAISDMVLNELSLKEGIQEEVFIDEKPIITLSFVDFGTHIATIKVVANAKLKK